MAIINESWLNRNDTRNYPFSDRAVLASSNGLVDMHIALPVSSFTTSRVYVSRLVVNRNACIVVVNLEGFGEIASLTVQRPQAYRNYLLSASVDGVRGFVSFGSAVNGDGGTVDETLGPDTGEILSSLIYRYDIPALTGFRVENQAVVKGDVLFQGVDDVVIEVVDVWYDEEEVSVPSMIIRLNRDVDAMTRMIPECKRPLESGLVDDVIGQVNGVIPSGSGVIVLELDSEFNYSYDEDGFVETDENGGRKFDNGTPLIQLVAGISNQLSFRDNLNYKLICGSRRRPITYSKNKCNFCDPAEIPGSGAAPDKADGRPISFGGAYINGDILTILWDYYGNGAPQVGVNKSPVVIMESDSADPVAAHPAFEIGGTSPQFPGALEPCFLTPETDGDIGQQVYTKYLLTRPLGEGEGFSVEAEEGLITDQTLGLRQPILSAAFSTCFIKAQEPE